MEVLRVSDQDLIALRERACRYQAMAQQINDRQAVKVLQDLAREYMDRVDRIEAAGRNMVLSDYSS